jgi:hypothetical protein
MEEANRFDMNIGARLAQRIAVECSLDEDRRVNLVYAAFLDRWADELDRQQQHAVVLDVVSDHGLLRTNPRR